MDDDLTRYLAGSDEERLGLLAKGGTSPILERYFGAAAYGELRELARRAREHQEAGHLGANAPKNLILVPGIMGSSLQPRELGGLWWVDVLRNRDKIDKLGLDPDGNDPDPLFAIEPVQVDQTYDEFLNAVWARPEDDFGCVKFPYDWRKPLWHAAGLLKAKVEELHGRDVGPIHLVGHSMGGLVIRAMLARHGDEALWPKLGRIAFIGTPHYGSPAISFYVKKHFYGTDMKAILALVLSRSTFRSLYGALALLPAPRGIYPGTRAGDDPPRRPDETGDEYVHPCSNFDIYRAEAWSLGLNADETGRLQKVLDHTRATWAELDRHHFETLTNERRGKMAMFVGMAQPTPFRMTIRLRLGGYWESVGRITSRREDDPHREGDGSVPMASAQLPHLGATRYVIGEHSVLQNLPMVYRDVFAWLKGEEGRMQLADSPEGALGGGHLAGSAPPSGSPHLDGSADAPGPHGRWDPDLQLAAPPEQILRELDAGRYPEFHRVRIL